jgi:3-hydroxybutyryl-CoA dehydrogenase
VGGGRLVLCDGRSASEIASRLHRHHSADLGLSPPDRLRVAVIDWPVDSRASMDGSTPLAYALADEAIDGPTEAHAHWDAVVADALRALGWRAVRVGDVAGLPVARTIAMLVNEASDAVQQGVCDEAGADAAMKLGVNYPAGPFEWLARCHPRQVVRLLDALDAQYRGERYRVSPRLRRRAWSPAAAR